MVRKGLTPIGICVVLSGCTGVRNKIPFVYHEQTSTADSAPFHRDPHRQYYDKLHKRYYYYDPVRKRYFWEDGQPKG